MCTAELEIGRISNIIEKLEATIPLIAEREAALSQLVAKAYTPRPVWLQVVERHIEAKHDLKIARKQFEQAKVAAKAATTARTRTISKLRQGVIAELNNSLDLHREASLYLMKAKNRVDHSRLVSPVDGTVQQLTIHTVGGVVTAAEPLMVVVPDGIELEAEVRILNKDVGFVRAGDNATVKIDSFPFTKYGHIDGTVVDVSKNAIETETIGLVYNARIGLGSMTIMADGREVDLIPGMTVAADFKIGKRRLIEFLLSPLLRYKEEALRER